MRWGVLVAVVAAWAGLSGMARAAGYDPLQTFAPLTLPDPVTSYRSANGAPGPDYWQNRADYDLQATLDTKAKALIGEAVITYTNNSPDVLDVLWLQLDQNIYRKDARAGFAAPARRGQVRKDFTEGYQLEAVEVLGPRGSKTATKADYVVSDTRMQVRLPQALKGRGGQVRLRIRYRYTIPGVWGSRTSWAKTADGEIYDIAQWYPRMAVYDDLRGWDTLPYLANEFYLEYGALDYAVTAPADFVVAGSGELANPKEVLSPEQVQRLDAARASDATVMIRTAAEAAAAIAAPDAAATKTWRFHMANSRDVAFSASKAFIWDAARIRLPDGKSSLAMSLYPPHSAGPQAWDRSTEYLKDSVEHFSARWTPYPWPVAINVAGPTGGMEYPGILFDDLAENGGKGKPLFWVTAHEIGHTWFPMVVGFDERRNAWMDEGFNTFIDIFESDEFKGGVFGPKRDGEYAPGPEAPADQIARLTLDPEAPAIVTRADAIVEKYRHPVTYFKSAFGLVLLREQILGPERFDPAFRKFIRDWSFKHPSPSDFFRAMSSEGGEDLSWFWRGWYLNTWTFDMAVQDVAYVDGDPRKGAQVTLANLDPMVLPAPVKVAFTDGTSTTIRVPVEAWIQKRSVVLTVTEGKPVAEVIIDPDHVLPDHDRSNNSRKGPG